MIGILPAAGHATRFNGLPKFLLPVQDRNLLTRHVEQMRSAGASRVLIGAGIHNADVIDKYRPAGTEMYMGGATLAETVLNAREECGDESVLFGMPDTYWTAPHVYSRMAHFLKESEVVVALWTIPYDQRGNLGQCLIDNDYRLLQVVDKDPNCKFGWFWGAIAWTPAFWQYIDPKTPSVSHSLQSAIESGVNIRATWIGGDYYDCGTFDQYAKLCSTFTNEVSHAAI